MDLNFIYRRLNITSPAVTSKCEEYVRQSRLKAPDWSKTVTKALAPFRTLLGLSDGVTPSQLAIQFGCTAAVPRANAIFAEFCKAFRAELPPERQSACDFSLPVFTAAAYYYAVMEHKGAVNRKALKDIALTDEKQFARVCALFERLIPSLAVAAKKPARAPKGAKTAKASGTKRPRSDVDAADNEDDLGVEGSSPHSHTYDDAGDDHDESRDHIDNGLGSECEAEEAVPEEREPSAAAAGLRRPRNRAANMAQKGTKQLTKSPARRRIQLDGDGDGDDAEQLRALLCTSIGAVKS